MGSGVEREIRRILRALDEPRGEKVKTKRFGAYLLEGGALTNAAEMLQYNFETASRAVAHYMGHNIEMIARMDYKEFYRDYVRAYRMQKDQEAAIEKMKKKK